MNVRYSNTRPTFQVDASKTLPAKYYTDPEIFRASHVLQLGAGYCVGKASLLAALCRAASLPARTAIIGSCRNSSWSSRSS